MMRKKRKLGKAFPDEVYKVTQPFGHFRKVKSYDQTWQELMLPNYEGEQGITMSSWRLVILICLFIVAFFILFLRTFHLQVVTGSKNRELADSNRIQIKTIHAPRGVIYDRSGKVLAENNPGFRFTNKDICKTKKPCFTSRDKALELEAKNDPAFNDLEIDTIRSYPLGVEAAHILGYVGEITQEELSSTEYNGYRLGDRIGRSGIEQIYESMLRGKDGAEIIEIDAQGRKLRSLRTQNPIPGQNVHLSIDIDLQKQVYQALKTGIEKEGSCCGAALVQDPKTGEILSLFSFPVFDANAFNSPERGGEVEVFFSDPHSPLLNRVISGTYPPGSVFKITSALSALSSGSITKQTQFEDTGVMYLGPYSFANWYFTQYGRKEGLVDVVKALQRSNDIFFYKIGELEGVEGIGRTAKILGFGKKLGIDLPAEEPGLIPSDVWKRKTYREPWYPGDDLHMAIGQGFVLVTPLQISAQMSYVASGYSVIPHLVTKITRQDGSEVKRIKPEISSKNVFKEENIKLVREGLGLVPKPGGTAWPFFNFSIPTAAKTGTAEFGHPQNEQSSIGRYSTHAWYTSYAPVDDPQITVTVLVEAGGEGSSVAGPIAKDIYTWYFNPDKNNIKSLDVYPVATSSAKLEGE